MGGDRALTMEKKLELGRREVLAGLAGTVVPGGRAAAKIIASKVMPALFIAHGHPLWSRDQARMRDFRTLSAGLPRPKSVLVVSAHWESAPVTLGATKRVPLVYDFSGFPAELYENKYPAPGAPGLAARVTALLADKGIAVRQDEARGLDHGAYVPLQMMYPAADVPILQISLPTLAPVRLFELGRALAPLRAEGVLIVGSGFLTHNLRRFDPRPDAPTPAWAAEFDAWAAEVIGKRDVDRLLAYRTEAPGVAIALPTHEHFVPVIVAAGASVAASEAVSFPITGWEAGSFTRRSVQFG
jgi:4,5-DOPA dioxygenase extradiol